MNEASSEGGRDIQSRTGPATQVSWEPSDRTVCLCEPPVPVIVRMRSVDPDAGQPIYQSSTTAPSLRVRASGIHFESFVDGYLLAQFRLSDGQWRCLVSVQIGSRNRRTSIGLTLYVRPEAIRLKTEGEAH